MNRKDVIFAAIALAVLGIFIFLTAIGRKPAPMSPRGEHTGLTAETPRETCLSCHAPDSSVAPMGIRHPKKGRPPDQMSCFKCHKPPAATIAFAIKNQRGSF
ncbi:MAG: hypothetical protein DMF61_10590 [Blastocatellia bacterium AA13]|nr:MAG: hypothetical protein DMF61_10590 [Blastocatellia bacterium AA13]